MSPRFRHLRVLPAVVAGALLATCARPPSLFEQVVSSGELRVVTRNTPTTFYHGAEEPRGVEYELARGFAEFLGVELKMYVAEQFGQIIPEINHGRAHVAAAGLTVTDTRRQLVEFGPSYQSVEQLVIYRRGTKRPREAGELVGGRLEVMAGSSYVDALEQAREQEPLLAWVENPNVGAEELIRRVAAGHVDYTVVDSNVFRLLRQFHPEAGIAFSLGSPGRLAWALPKGDGSLRESVAAYFAEIEATGKLEETLDRYYFASRDFDYVGARAFVRHFEARLPRVRLFFQEAELDTGIDWRLLAAIAYQESHWDLDAVSPTGVRGIMMLTQPTARMMRVDDRLDPRESILGGARYLARLLRTVPARIAEPDRTWFALAAYNIGYGHLEDARIITQIQGGDPDRWSEVRERLPLLSDERWHTRVARGYARGQVPVLYVDNVRRYYELLQWVTANDAGAQRELSAVLRVEEEDRG